MIRTVEFRLTVRRVALEARALKFAWRALCSSAHVKSLGDAQGQNFPGNECVHDVAIVGGGMVGMALAGSLARSPLTKHLNVAIIDSNPMLLSEDNIKKEDPPDSRVWDYTGLAYTRYNAKDISKEVLGCVVENKVLQRSLLSCLQSSDFRNNIYPSRLDSMIMQPQGGSAKLELNNGSSLHAKLVVGADGSKSRVRDLAGIRTTGWKYSQNAIICTVEHLVENQCAWQRFLPNGPIALLPIGDNFSNIVWTMTPEESYNRKLMSDADFVEEVNRALDKGYGPHPHSQPFVGGDTFSMLTGMPASANESFEVPPKALKLSSERMVFPLSLMHANRYTSKRVVLIGDAAHTVHPLAGQGVNMGFADAFALSKVITEGIAVGSDIGEVSILKRYESERKPENLAMMAILDGFHKAYSVNFGPLNMLRAAAFSIAHRVYPLKRNIISYASGELKFPIFS